jgi:iron complex transport system ATP-binding protein
MTGTNAINDVGRSAQFRLSCENLTVSIGNICVAKDLDLEMEPGQFWGLLGPNGIGKTTLIRCLAGLMNTGSGKVFLQDQELDALPRRIVARHLGMLQQHTAYVFDATVLQTALTGRHPHLSHWQREGPGDLARAHEALTSVDLNLLAQRSVTGLSGGEARRLAFAALLVQDPEIMLLDEPTNHLDLRHQVQIMSMITEQVSNRSKSALAALHDVNLAARYCSHLLLLFGDGRWMAGRSEDLLSSETLEELYRCPVERLESKHGPRFHPLP